LARHLQAVVPLNVSTPYSWQAVILSSLAVHSAVFGTAFCTGRKDVDVIVIVVLVCLVVSTPCTKQRIFHQQFIAVI